MTDLKLIALPGKQDFTLTCTIAAPRDLVFRTYADPRWIPEWWGPRRLTSVVETMEVRPGGRWRIIQHDAQGTQFAFHGVYHLVDRPERIVSTFEYEETPGTVLLETVTFEELQGRTKMTDHAVFQSAADRDGMVQAGMQEGASESMDRFSQLLARLSQTP